YDHVVVYGAVDSIRNPALYLVRARRLAELKRWEKAEADLAKAAELKPDDPQVIVERGRIYAEFGKPDQAAADFAQAFKLVPQATSEDLAAPWFADPVGLDADLARWNDAFAELAKLRPKDKRVWIARLRGLARRSEWQKARDAVAEFIKLDPLD